MPELIDVYAVSVSLLEQDYVRKASKNDMPATPKRRELSSLRATIDRRKSALTKIMETQQALTIKEGEDE